MRISDWSSDVCSSDLVGRKPIKLVLRPIFQALGPVSEHRRAVRHDRYQEVRREGLDGVPLQPDDWIRAANSAKPNDAIQERLRLRSEEHTSELQSLMRISYAVFCLKKKKYKITQQTTTTTALT